MGQKAPSFRDIDPKSDFAPWQAHFNALPVFEVGIAFAQALQERHPCLASVSFHSAVIDNQMTNAGLNPKLTESKRWACEEFADYVFVVASSMFKGRPMVVRILHQAVERYIQANATFGASATGRVLH